jgi:transcriptional regulator with XRE-family HTH domain
VIVVEGAEAEEIGPVTLERDPPRLGQALERDLALDAAEQVVGNSGHQRLSSMEFSENSVKWKVSRPRFVMWRLALYSKFVYSVNVFDPLPNQRAPTLVLVPGPKVKTTKAESTGDRIRELRKLRGLTQTELGKLIGVSQRVITYYENEGGSLSPELLARIAGALRVTADQLLGRKKDRTPGTTPENLRLWRRLKRVEDLPPQDKKAVLKMIDALTERSDRKRTGTA